MLLGTPCFLWFLCLLVSSRITHSTTLYALATPPTLNVLNMNRERWLDESLHTEAWRPCSQYWGIFPPRKEAISRRWIFCKFNWLSWSLTFTKYLRFQWPWATSSELNLWYFLLDSWVLRLNPCYSLRSQMSGATHNSFLRTVWWPCGRAVFEVYFI